MRHLGTTGLLLLDAKHPLDDGVSLANYVSEDVIAMQSEYIAHVYMAVQSTGSYKGEGTRLAAFGRAVESILAAVRQRHLNHGAPNSTPGTVQVDMNITQQVHTQLIV